MNRLGEPRALLFAVYNRVSAVRSYDAGRAAPPSERAKRRHLLELFGAGGHRTLIESGTYLGGTVAFFLDHADRILSVEIDERLHQRARTRFADEPKVELLLGDSLDCIPAAVAQMTSPPLVWLDGHFSGIGTGQGAELEPAPTLLQRIADASPPAGTTIAVDDVRLFGSDEDFPSLDELITSARRAFPAARMHIALDALVLRLGA